MIANDKKAKTMLGFIGWLATASAAWAAQDHLRLKETEAEYASEGGKKTISVEIKTAAAIPTDGKSGAFGYAALNDKGNNLLVLVSHLPIDDSSYEQVPSGFHTHVLDLKEPTPACPGANFEVDVENSKKNAAFDANYKWSVEGKEAEIKGVPVSDLGDAGIENVVSFTLKPVAGADGKPTNLCVTVVEQL